MIRLIFYENYCWWHLRISVEKLYPGCNANLNLAIKCPTNVHYEVFLTTSDKIRKISTYLTSINLIVDNKSEQYKFINTDFTIMSRKKLLFIVSSLHSRLRSSVTRLRPLHGYKTAEIYELNHQMHYHHQCILVLTWNFEHFRKQRWA